MKYLIKALLVLSLICVFSCTENHSIKFKISQSIDGYTNYKRIDTITNLNSKLDIYFYKKHFKLFYGLPNNLIIPKLKNQEVIKWANENTAKSLNKNWSESYKYDSEGKLIEYKYSSCAICSQVAWGYKLYYDKNKNVTEQKLYNLSENNIDSKVGLVPNSKFDESMLTGKIKLTYNKNNDLIQVVQYDKNGVETSTSVKHI